MVKILKILDEENIKPLVKLFICNKIYTSGQLPNDWLLSRFLMLDTENLQH